jgi:hypothetical protein
VKIAAGGYHNLALQNDGRPALTLQPLSQVVGLGATVRLVALAAGLQPLSYQWQRNGANWAGATTNALVLTNVQPAQGGSYVLVVTNAAGAVFSSVASLTVLPTGSIVGLSVAPPLVSVAFASAAGFSYVLEYKNTLPDPSWTALSPAVPGTGGVIPLQDTNAPAASRYYRVHRQ